MITCVQWPLSKSIGLVFIRLMAMMPAQPGIAILDNIPNAGYEKCSHQKNYGCSGRFHQKERPAEGEDCSWHHPDGWIFAWSKTWVSFLIIWRFCNPFVLARVLYWFKSVGRLPLRVRTCLAAFEECAWSKYYFACHCRRGIKKVKPGGTSIEHEREQSLDRDAAKVKVVFGLVKGLMIAYLHFKIPGAPGYPDLLKIMPLA